jgi:hypothetical protein
LISLAALIKIELLVYFKSDFCSVERVVDAGFELASFPKLQDQSYYHHNNEDQS